MTIASGAESYRFGNELVKAGDSTAEVLNTAGNPDVIESLETEFGGAAGQRWHYRIEGYDSKTVVVVLYRGRVVHIEIFRH